MKENQTREKIGNIEYTIYEDGTIDSRGSIPVGWACWGLGALVKEVLTKENNNNPHQCVLDFCQGLDVNPMQALWVKMEDVEPILYENMDIFNRQVLFTTDNDTEIHFGVYNKERNDFYEYKTKKTYKSHQVKYWLGMPDAPSQSNKK